MLRMTHLKLIWSRLVSVEQYYSEPAHSPIPTVRRGPSAVGRPASETVRGKVRNLGIQLYLEVLKRDF